MTKLSFKNHLFLLCIIHDGPVLLQFADLDLILSQLFISLLPDVAYCRFVLSNYLIVVLLIKLLQLSDFILQGYGLLKFLIIVRFQLSLDFGLIDLLLAEFLMQLTDLILELLNF
jgi:hypothetical protein